MVPTEGPSSYEDDEVQHPQVHTRVNRRDYELCQEWQEQEGCWRNQLRGKRRAFKHTHLPAPHSDDLRRNPSWEPGPVPVLQLLPSERASENLQSRLNPRPSPARLHRLGIALPLYEYSLTQRQVRYLCFKPHLLCSSSCSQEVQVSLLTHFKTRYTRRKSR